MHRAGSQRRIVRARGPAAQARAERLQEIRESVLARLAEQRLDLRHPRQTRFDLRDRARLSDETSVQKRVGRAQDLIGVDAVSKGRNHYSGKIAFDKNGFLFLSLGDRQVPPEGKLEAHPAQDLTNHHGKIVRLHDDGKVPTDNPFVNRAGARPEIWSYGHRNVQGLAIHPETGDLWADEHGPQGGDEVNRIQPGKNYGWPVIGFGVNYTTGLAIHAGTHRDGMEQPVRVWVPSIGISGMMFYTGDKFPQWRGNMFIGGMNGQQLSRLTMSGERIVNEEELVQQRGRIRDIRQGPDGFIYLVTDDRDGKPTPVYRLEPVQRTAGS